jgi:hypothetical protein
MPRQQTAAARLGEIAHKRLTLLKYELVVEWAEPARVILTISVDCSMIKKSTAVLGK